MVEHSSAHCKNVQFPFMLHVFVCLFVSLLCTHTHMHKHEQKFCFCLNNGCNSRFCTWELTTSHFLSHFQRLLLWRPWWRSQQSTPSSCCCPRKHGSRCPIPLPQPFCLLFAPVLFPVGRELAAVSPTVHLLRPLWPGGLPGPGLQACPQGPPSWGLAAGAGRQQSQPYPLSSLLWTVVATGADFGQVPDKGSWISGGNFRTHLQLKEQKKKDWPMMKGLCIFLSTGLFLFVLSGEAGSQLEPAHVPPSRLLSQPVCSQRAATATQQLTTPNWVQVMLGFCSSFG